MNETFFRTDTPNAGALVTLNDDGLLFEANDSLHSTQITDTGVIQGLVQSLQNWLYQHQCDSRISDARCSRRRGHDGVHRATVWVYQVGENVRVEWSYPAPVTD